MFGKLLLIFGILVLVHSARSVIEFREFKEASGTAAISLPLDMYAEIFIGLFVGMFGCILNAGSLKPLHAKYESIQRSYEDLVNVKSFRVFKFTKDQ
jgi:hypothetical protein